ncbi:unnamed protein product [Echinostoma caproni]|uniref:N-acetylgalactosaminide beta-1,3-galactosyltransferase n=1 Tax=Echinostoma caproni TaxID=27848 RepID=A0A183A8E7_9TREM|nr:unnamed protein product [Echinostoma caproni]
MKGITGTLYGIRYWLALPSGFFFGIIFGMHLARQYEGSIPVLYAEDKTQPLDISISFATETEGRDQLWTKTKFGLHHALERYSDYDFFLKADDDTYTIVENLRYLLKDHDPEVPIIMGRRWRPHVKQGYPSGGGGYVLSRSALKLIVAGLDKNPACNGNVSGGAEDVRIGACAQEVGVKLVDSLDDKGLERFHPFSAIGMINHVNEDHPKWYGAYNYHKVLTGYRCCSSLSVTFHYVSPEDMNLYEFFLYRLRPAVL